MDGMTLYVNVVAKASLRTRPWTKEDMMMFKLKFSDKLPIKDLSSYIKDALTDQKYIFLKPLNCFSGTLQKSNHDCNLKYPALNHT